MALIKFGGGITEMRGSMAGNVFSRNKSGAYVRARTKPTNPNTALQQAVRNALAQLTVRWSQTVTAAQRTAWNLYASSVSMTNKLGESIFLSGFNQYLRSNIVLLQSGGTIVDAGPTTFELPDTDPAMVASGSEGTQLVSIAFNDALVWLDEDDAYMHLWQGSPQNAQRNFFDGPWRYLTSLAGDSVTPLTSPQTAAASFAITELQRVWVYARIQRADGRLSEPFRSDFFVGA